MVIKLPVAQNLYRQAPRGTFGIGSFGFRLGVTVGWRYVLVLTWGRRRRRIVWGELIMIKVGRGPLGFLVWTCGTLRLLA